MAHEQPFIIDHSDALAHARFVSRVGGLRGKGKWAWTAKPYRAKRSLKANAFWWAVIIPAFQRFMREHGQFFEPDEIHEYLLVTLVPKAVVNPKTGEVTYVGRRSSKMDKLDFSELCNLAIDWMRDKFDVDLGKGDFARDRKATVPA